MRSWMWRPMCSLVVALIAIPAISAAADEKPYKFDEQKIVECLEAAYKQAPGNKDAIAGKCTRLEYDACMKIQDSTWSVAKMFCESMEAQVWDRLLQAQYDRAVAAIGKLDDHYVSSGMWTQPVLPAFIEAHAAWNAFIGAQCNYEGVKVRAGTMRFDGPSSCALAFIAKRTIEYQQAADAAEWENKVRQQEREKNPR